MSTGLVGRVAERAELDRLVGAARHGRSAAIVLHGDAGIGKSALLGHAIESASDLRVVRTSGIESEIQLGFAALHRMLLPFLGARDRLPAPQRDALGTAFGFVLGPPADRFLVALAALTMLTEAAADQPMLCVVDDAQWIDRASLEALAFIGRRLHADRVALLFGVREKPEGADPLAGLPTMQVDGLPEPDALALVSAAVDGPLDHAVARRIVAETRGSPLALVELADGLSAPQLSGSEALPEPFPISERLESHFRDRARTLPADAQMFLLLSAAETSGDPWTVRQAASWLGLDADAEVLVSDADLLEMRPRVQFRHPLVRSAVYRGATITERRRVHEALAAVTDPQRDPDRRAWHRSAAAVGPDESVAEELEQSAQRARGRGGYAAEASFLTRASELSSDPQRRARRMLAASKAAWTAGSPQQAAAMLHEATPGLDNVLLRAEAQRLEATLRSSTVPGEVAAVLLAAAQDLEALDVRLARDTYAEALQASLVSAQLTRGTTPIEVARASLAATPVGQAETTIADILVDGLATRLVHGFAAAVPALRRGVAALCADDVESSSLARWAVLGNDAAAELWDSHGSRTLLDRLERSERDGGALDRLSMTLDGLAHSEMRAGRFAAADAYLSEAGAIAVAIGGEPHIWELFKAELMAWYGRDTETRAAVAALTGRLAAISGAGAIVNLAAMALVILELGQGNYADALPVATRLMEDDPPPFGNQALPEVVEAGVRSNDREAAAAALARLSERAQASGTPWALGLLARSEALMTDGTDAEQRYRAAIDHLGRSEVVTDLARAHLLYGEWLRRQQQRLDAREQLRLAHEMFSTMGATAFAERARVELAATGEHARKRTVDTSSDLTPQEGQIARLVSQGATNQEVAARLYISSSTVDYHLRKVYRKLGVSSRRQLARALAR